MSRTLYSFEWVAHNDVLAEEYRNGREKSDFKVEKPDEHCVSWVIKVVVSSDAIWTGSSLDMTG